MKTKELSFTATVGIRKPAFKESAESDVVKTLSTDTIKNITVSSSITIGDLRSQISAELKQKNIDSDFAKGRLYYAQAVKNLKVSAVKDQAELLTALRKGTNGGIVNMTIAAASPEAEPDEE
eukprot:gene34819-39365_t